MPKVQKEWESNEVMGDCWRKNAEMAHRMPVVLLVRKENAASVACRTGVEFAEEVLTMADQYYSQDITFCTNRKCIRKTCPRNPCHIRHGLKPYQSFADFDGTEYCPKGDDENG